MRGSGARGRSPRSEMRRPKNVRRIGKGRPDGCLARLISEMRNGPKLSLSLYYRSYYILREKALFPLLAWSEGATLSAQIHSEAPKPINRHRTIVCEFVQYHFGLDVSGQFRHLNWWWIHLCAWIIAWMIRIFYQSSVQFDFSAIGYDQTLKNF